ncbi:hypothetical protein FRB99_003010 [Tulasnella sp. 403]|nr:hypothetical protein FRB99_003010 [Tulasnella sp. 403]
MQNSPRETINLGSLTVPRLLIGLWQLSSPGWGSSSPVRIRREMLRHVQAGYNAFGQSSPTTLAHLFISLSNRYADHYGGAEVIFGGFRSSLPNPQAVIGATKWCVFGPIEVTRQVVQDAINERNAK